MLKKLSIAGLALIASSGIALADTSDSMPAGSDANTNLSDSSSSGSDAGMNNASSDSTASTSAPSTTVAHKKHKKHHHKKHAHKHHYQAAASNSASTDSEPVAAAAPAGGYKGEMPCPTCTRPPFVVGPYVGVGVGSRVNYVSSGSIYTGAEGSLFGGYSMMWDEFYGALEIAVQDSAQVNNYTNGTSSAKSSWSYGLSLIPGYMLTDDVLGYIRLGVLNTRFSTGNSNVTGGQVGLGMETQLCSNWDLRGEYVYDFYNALSGNGGSPKTQQFNLGLLYKFQM